jgi:hypothetical protein
MTARTAYVVLGGSGRLGQRLLPFLARLPGTVLALSRQPQPDTPDVTWLTADLAASFPDPHTINGLLGCPSSVMIIDLVLDRTSVRAMRLSIDAATQLSIGLHRHCRQEGTDSRIVAASTTAVLAPAFLQTPYGAAKHRQACRYAREQAVDLVLLPQLGTPGQRTFGEAARALTRVLRTPSADRCLWVLRPPSPSPGPRDPFSHLPRAALLSLAARTVRRDDPAAFRAATRKCIAQLPLPARERLDHHVAPPFLLRRLERQLFLPTAMPLTTEKDRDTS